MTRDDLRPFTLLLGMLAETFDASLSETRIDAYFVALADLAWPQVEFAMREAIATLKFFPKPAELRELVAGTAEDNAQEAWTQLVLEGRRTGSYGRPDLPEATERAMVAVFGSWQNFCLAEILGPEGIGWRKQYIQAYGTYQRREQQGERLLSTAECRNILDDLRARMKTLPEERES